jgi:hypothetical protein
MKPDPALVGFVFNLIRSGILTEQQARELYREYVELGLPATLSDCCDFLIKNGSVTAWQINKLKEGKWKGFLMDHYLLLEKVGNPDELNFRARDTRDGSIVYLAVTPMNQAKGPNIEYRVVDELPIS